MSQTVTYATIRRQCLIFGTLTSKEPASAAVESVNIRGGAEPAGSAAYGDTLTFEAQVPSEVWESLRMADKASSVQANEAAFAALALLLNKLSGQNEVKVYAYRPEDGRIKLVPYHFDLIDGIPELAAAFKTDGGQWLEQGAFMCQWRRRGAQQFGR